MGQCKRCGGVYGAHEMTEGICNDCLSGKDKENIVQSNSRNERSTTFWFIIFSLVTLFFLFVAFVIYFF